MKSSLFQSWMQFFTSRAMMKLNLRLYAETRNQIIFVPIAGSRTSIYSHPLNFLKWKSAGLFGSEKKVIHPSCSVRNFNFEVQKPIRCKLEGADKSTSLKRRFVFNKLYVFASCRETQQFLQNWSWVVARLNTYENQGQSIGSFQVILPNTICINVCEWLQRPKSLW